MVILSGCAKANLTLGFKTNGSLPNQAVDAYIIWLQIKRCWSGYFLQATLRNNYIVSIYGIYYCNQVYIRQLMWYNTLFVYITNVTCYMCVGARVETKVRELNTMKWCILNITFAFLTVGICE